MASAVQQLFPWRRKTVTVSGKEPHFQNCTYLGPVSVLDAHNTYAALRSAWNRHRLSRGLGGCQVTLRLKVNRLEMSYINQDSRKCEEFFLHRIVTCQNSIDPPSSTGDEPSFQLSSDDDQPPELDEIPAAENERPPANTLVAWTYRHQHKKARVAFKAHVVDLHSTKRAAEFQTAMSDKLVFSLEEYRRERIQRQSCRARMVRTRSVDSGLQKRMRGPNNATPLRKTTLSAARHFKPESKGAPKLQILTEATDEEEEETPAVASTARRLSRLGLALVD